MQGSAYGAELRTEEAYLEGDGVHLSELDGLVRYYLRKTAKEASNTPYIIRKMLHRYPL